MTFAKFFKATILTLLFVTSISFVYGQFSGGGHVGANMGNLRGSSVTNNSPIVGINIGGFVNYGMKDILTGDIADRLSIQVELNIETKGAELDYVFYDTRDTSKQTLTDPTIIKQNFTYVVVPMLVKYTTEEKNNISFYGEAGPYMAGLFGLRFDGEVSRDNDLSNKIAEVRKYRDDYSGFDFGFTAGAGINYRLPFGGRRQPFTGFANVRYSLGLNNVGQIKEKTNDIPEFMLDDIKTNTISIGIGISYRIPIRRR
ncbi:MAG: porin family protein [Bacteroidales bacterium]